MPRITRKYYPSKYKYVQNLKVDGKDVWCINMLGISKAKFDTERNAAIAVDKLLISKGREPVNILVRK
jgi:hypothetical protein